MIPRLHFQLPDNSIRRLLAYGAMLLFVFTADAIMSYWVPPYVQGKLNSSLLMGFVMSFSSLVGLGADLLFPQLLRRVGLKTIIGLLFVASLSFVGVMFLTTWWPLVLLMLLGMAVWGIYYELIMFADQQFVAGTVEPQRRSAAWGIISVFKSLAYVLGPILAGWALVSGDRSVLIMAASLTLTAVVIFMFMRFKAGRELPLPHQEINLLAEIGHWRVLIAHIWPILVMSLMMGVVDATFWTTGTVWSEKLAQIHALGGLFVSAYILPSLFIGLIVAKLGIYQGKKKLATVFLLLSNLVLAGLGLSREIWWQLFIVLVSSTLSGFAYPLVEAVYTDIVARMGRERKHLIGLAGSTFSLAYIFGPIIAGFIAQLVGEQQTFVVIGLGAALVTFILLFVTPRKLKLPAATIQAWSD